MPRKSRIDAPGALHHIVIRGIERKAIFYDNSDRINFFERLDRIKPETETGRFACALMRKYVHRFLKTDLTSIATAMRRLLKAMANSIDNTCNLFMRIISFHHLH